MLFLLSVKNPSAAEQCSLFHCRLYRLLERKVADFKTSSGPVQISHKHQHHSCFQKHTHYFSGVHVGQKNVMNQVY